MEVFMSVRLDLTPVFQEAWRMLRYGGTIVVISSLAFGLLSNKIATDFGCELTQNMPLGTGRVFCGITNDLIIPCCKLTGALGIAILAVGMGFG